MSSRNLNSSNGGPKSKMISLRLTTGSTVVVGGAFIAQYTQLSKVIKTLALDDAASKKKVDEYLQAILTLSIIMTVVSLLLTGLAPRLGAMLLKIVPFLVALHGAALLFISIDIKKYLKKKADLTVAADIASRKKVCENLNMMSLGSIFVLSSNLLAFTVALKSPKLDRDSYSDGVDYDRRYENGSSPMMNGFGFDFEF